MTATPPADPTIAFASHLADCACTGCRAMREREAEEALLTGQAAPGAGQVASAGVQASLGQMADYLTTGFWGNGVGQWHNLGTTGRDPNDGVLYYNVSGFDTLPFGGGSDTDGITAARAALVRDVFDVYSAVLGIEFVETTSQDHTLLDFYFSDNKSGAYAGSPRWSDGEIYYSYINVAASWSGGTSTYDDYTLQTLFHEVGHALGLGHQGQYNGSGRYVDDAEFALDSWQATMMSYFSQTENTAIDASYELLQTPMAVDWIALDDIYGRWGYTSANAFTGDTVWGFNTTITEDESRIFHELATYAGRTAATVVDGGGTDTLDLSGFAADQRIDLTVQTEDMMAQNASDVGGRTGNLTLAVGTVIENAVGGAGDDVILGNAADNRLEGGAGDDIFVGYGGNDVFDGGAGTDLVEYSYTIDSYGFSVLGRALQVVGEGIDLVLDTIETLQFHGLRMGVDDLLLLYANQAPEAADDAARVAEDGRLSLDVLGNDRDADGDALSIVAVAGTAIAPGQGVTLASGARVTLETDGTLTYDPAGAFDALEAGQTAPDSFTYTVSDPAGDTAQAEATVTVEGVTPPPPPAPPPAVFAQSGTVTTDQRSAQDWHSVTFDAVIEDAVVVMGPVSRNGGHEAFARVRNVTDEGFEFQIREWDYLDGAHTTETVGWFAVSEGVHTLQSGQTIAAGTQRVADRFEWVGFGTALDEAIVLTGTSSAEAPEATTTRIRDVYEKGAVMRLQREQAGDPPSEEEVSWIAVETGRATGLEAILTPEQLDHDADRFWFETDFDAAPVLLADMQTQNGGDAAVLRRTVLQPDGVSLYVEEEQSLDAEKLHGNEAVGILALEDGLFYDDILV